MTVIWGGGRSSRSRKSQGSLWWAEVSAGPREAVFEGTARFGGLGLLSCADGSYSLV